MRNAGGLLLDRLRWVAKGNNGSAAAIQTLLVRFGVLFVNLANGVYTARHLGPAGRGTQAALLLWVTLLTIFAPVGMPQALRYYGRNDEKNVDNIFGATLLWSFVLGIIAAVITAVVMPRLMWKYDPSDVHDAQLTLIYLPLGIVSTVFTAMLETRFQFSLANLTRYAPPLLTFPILVTLGFTHSLTPYTVVLGYIIPNAMVALYIGFGLFRELRPHLGRFLANTKRLFAYGIQIFGAAILSAFSQQVDQLLVVGILSATELGRYTVALQASRVLMIVQNSLESVVSPKATGVAREQTLYLVSTTTRLTIAITFFGAVLLSGLLPFILPRIYGGAYIPAVFIGQILCFEAFISSTANALIQTFKVTNFPGLATVFQFLGLATAVPLMILLIPHFGLTGATLALLGSSIVRLLFAIASYPIILKVPPPSLMPSKPDFDFLVKAIRPVS